LNGISDTIAPEAVGRKRRPSLVLPGYLLVVAVLIVGWWLRDQNLTRAADGVGYLMGILGASLMLLLLIYPLRKRLRSWHSLGSVKFWFQTHMIFGVLGPVLVVLHSNFSLGSFNSTVALVCTLVVAGSGIVGRYLYAKIHHGMHGQRVSLDEMRGSGAAPDGSVSAAIFQIVRQRLATEEAQIRQSSAGVIGSFRLALRAPWTTRRLKVELTEILSDELDAMAEESTEVAAHRDRLLQTAGKYIDGRLAKLKTFSQLSAFERLFGLWHVVHFPLFLVMVLAAIVHVIAVHAY